MKVVSFGFGPIGQAIARVALGRQEQIEIIGAVDLDPSLVGKDVGEVLNGEKTGTLITDTPNDIFSKADLVLHATSSFLDVAKSQLLDICKHSLDIISTCEELSFPWYNHANVASEIDSAAKKNGATVLATGVNPGFVLDALVISATGACHSVREIRGERILDALKRRLPFQKKVGIGLSVEQFEENVKSGKFGHIGLPESMAMVCSALGRDMERFEQKVTPKIAEKDTPTANHGVVNKGKVLGLVQDASAFVLSKKAITYHLEMYAGAEDPHDEIEVLGEPNLKLRIPGGTPGDSATAAVVVNSVQRVVDSKPGLMTVKDLKPASSVFSF